MSEIRTVQITITISRSIEQVFGYLTDIRNFPEWDSQIREIKFIPQRNAKKGDTFESLDGKKVRKYIITICEPSSRLKIKEVQGVGYTVDYKLKKINEKKTELTLTQSVNKTILTRIISPFLKRKMTKIAKENLEKLQLLL